MTKFEKLGLSKDVTEVLIKQGIKDPTEIQEKAIPIALAGKDIIGGSSTGSGKTLAFASPIIENLKQNDFIQALILTPTRELAEQVATSIKDFSKNKKLNVLAVYGGVNIERQTRQIAKTDVLVGTPGRILDHIGRGTLRFNGVKILVLDEVDRMFDMGFARDVETIIAECPKKRQTMMFSATISSDIDYLAKKYSNKPTEVSVKAHVDPSKLKQVYYDVPDNKKFSLLVHLLKQEESNFVLVFCSTRRNVDFVTDNLIRSNVKAKAIHGGMDQKKRLRVLEEFKKKGTGVLICTDVAARGLDIEGVSHVYNYDISMDSKDYIHRIGRTARAGKEGKAITILASRDYEKFGNIMNSDSININPEKLPQFERVMIRIDSGRDNKKFSRGPRRGPRGHSRSRDSNRGHKPKGRYGSSKDSRPRSGPGRSFGSRSHSSRDGSRRYSSSGPRRTGSYNRDDPRRSFRNRSSGDSPKRYSRSSSNRPRTNRSSPRRYTKDNNSGRNGPPSRRNFSRDRPKRYSRDGPKRSHSSHRTKPKRSFGNRNRPRTNTRRPRRK